MRYRQRQQVEEVHLLQPMAKKAWSLSPTSSPSITTVLLASASASTSTCRPFQDQCACGFRCPRWCLLWFKRLFFRLCSLRHTGWFGTNCRFRAGIVVTMALNRVFVPKHPVCHFQESIGVPFLILLNRGPVPLLTPFFTLFLPAAKLSGLWEHFTVSVAVSGSSFVALCLSSGQGMWLPRKGRGAALSFNVIFSFK